MEDAASGTTRQLTHAGSPFKLRMLARWLIYACWLAGYFARQMKGLSDLARLRLTLCCEMLAIADYGDRSGFGSLNTCGWDGNEMSIAHGPNEPKKRTDLVYSMSTASYSNSTRTRSGAISDLQSQVQACKSFPALLSVQAGTENTDPLTWLRNQSTDIKIAWSNRDSDECFVAAGAAAEVVAKAGESIKDTVRRCRDLIAVSYTHLTLPTILRV